MPEPIIGVNKLEKIYGGDGTATPALRGVSFDIQKGEFTAIMGPSGSGKSTLLHILGFLDRPTGGTYLFEGREMNSYDDDALARLRNKKFGFVFQAFNLLARSSVLDNVKLPLSYADIPEAKQEKMAFEAIGAVGLSHRTHHESSKLSGGEKQRVAIARALVNDPDIIFADEPTGNLDSKSGGQVMEFIENLHDQGRTIILITHETYTAEYAQRVIKLKDGLMESDQRVQGRQHSRDGFKK
ncbi:MAG: ABC-type antimicrobial peptide transport system ATPase component [Candidatus Yanofskybacteria bacterium GW2011_GWA2_44_9]|uniref:ABC-type antimicrobial peptide transport system ATPase component n=1 Tax=Candidatus Yanofskybacteria bacterium GW2011_GWA2_44_9 TaxID=1619025 RepID=A0A0G1KD62_9BACT|nr:MAG: ABC-type antimicrobial peptide transport system ATPase component [Candidatus Yanofskybacteria bacterium GW2011_GWA2_44_9]